LKYCNDKNHFLFFQVRLLADAGFAELTVCHILVRA
jgi:hypothetical protein